VRAIPPIALIPPAIILIGLGDNMKILVTCFVAIWPIVLNTADGVREIDQTMLDTGRALRLTPRQKMQYVTAPSVAPRVFTGLHTALIFCIIGIIATEYLAGTEGVGFLLQDSQVSFKIDLMWAVILLLGLFGNLVNVLFNFVQKRTLYWKSDVENF
jgi:ABC-type nitrate/sulfonate/bicarbonate transport system permease component